MLQFLLVAMAVASNSITITKSSLFRSVRVKLDKIKVLKCPYCLNHWLSFLGVALYLDPINFGDFMLKSFGLITLSSILALPLLLLLQLADKRT